MICREIWDARFEAARKNYAARGEGDPGRMIKQTMVEREVRPGTAPKEAVINSSKTNVFDGFKTQSN